MDWKMRLILRKKENISPEEPDPYAIFAGNPHPVPRGKIDGMGNGIGAGSGISAPPRPVNISTCFPPIFGILLL